MKNQNLYKKKIKRYLDVILKEPFPYWFGAILLGILNVGLFAVSGEPWHITSHFVHCGAWIARALGVRPELWAFYGEKDNAEALAQGFLRDGGSIQNLGIIAGAMLAALLASQFRFRKIKSYKQVIGAVIGGFLMGYGARLAFGCNIGALFSGISSMSLHGWIFMASMLAGTYLGSRILIRFFLY